jgi:hypothetical protein
VKIALRRSESILSGAPIFSKGYAAFAFWRNAAVPIWCPSGAHFGSRIKRQELILNLFFSRFEMIKVLTNNPAEKDQPRTAGVANCSDDECYPVVAKMIKQRTEYESACRKR